MANPNSTYPGSLLSTTLNLLEGDIQDAITSHQAFLASLADYGFKREKEGAPYITHMLEYAQNTTVSSYSGDDLIDTTLQDNFTAANFDWKQVGGIAGITGIDRAKNSGSRAQVADLYAANIENLKNTFAIKVNAMLFSDGSGNGSKDIQGLDLFIEDSGSYSTVGGINSNTYTWWRNQYTSVADTFSAKGETSMLNMVNNCARVKGNYKVDLIVTTQALYEAYVNSGVRLQRVLSTNKRMLDLGFPNAEYMGIPIVWDSDCTSTDMYFLSTRSFYWNVLKGFDMKALPSVRPVNQDVELTMVLLYANLSCGNRARNGVLTGITTP